MKRQTNTSHEKQAGYSGFYLERSGIDAAKLGEVLASPPEHPLDDAEKAEARQFEMEMLKRQVGIGMTLEDALKVPMAESSVAPLFFAESIIKGNVQIDGVEFSQFHSHDDVYRWILTAGLSKGQLMELSKQSTEAYKGQVAEALVNDGLIDESVTDAQSLVIDVENFIRQMKGLTSARMILREWRNNAPRGTNLDDAKLAYNDVFLAKINDQLAQAVPIVEYIRRQAELVGDEHMIRQAEELVPRVMLRALEDDTARQRLFRRLDFLRNGIGYNTSGEATGVSMEIATTAAEVPRGGIFTYEQMQSMKETILTPDEMKQIFRDILNKAGLLSGEDESTWAPDRTTRAADGLFQVVINPGKATFEVDSTSGVYKVSSEPRSLYDVVIVGGFHELEHINQAIADTAIGQMVKVAQIKGKRVSGLREAGANLRQRQAEEYLFGYSKPYADTYASALRALEAGGSIADAAKAFYDAKLRAMPDSDKMSAAREAADRVLRLVRGGINSQPMVYAEESILTQELQQAARDVQRRALAVTGLDLVDQAKLHRFGLLEVPSSGAIDWTSYVLDELKKRMKPEDI